MSSDGIILCHPLPLRPPVQHLRSRHGPMRKCSTGTGSLGATVRMRMCVTRESSKEHNSTGEEMFQINIHLHDRWLLDQKTDESAMSSIKNQLHLPQTNVSSLSDSNANHVHGGEIGCSDAVSSSWIANHLRLTRCCTAHLSSRNINWDDVSEMRLCLSASRGRISTGESRDRLPAISQASVAKKNGEKPSQMASLGLVGCSQKTHRRQTVFFHGYSQTKEGNQGIFFRLLGREVIKVHRKICRAQPVFLL